MGVKSAIYGVRTGKPITEIRSASHAGALIVNADDWGRDDETTTRTVDCLKLGTVSSVSAMVFMAGSERAAAIAQERGIDAGLHLNFTTTFSTTAISAKLAEHQQRLAQYLGRNRLAQAVFHPGLRNSFKYVVAAQLDEFVRLYGTEPKRLDGHHHMHLCTNVLMGKLLPSGTIVRRSFSFRAGEKSLANRFYRSMVDRQLAKRHLLTDLFFSLTPFEPKTRLERIFSLARHSVIEVETHPINRDEYRFLTTSEINLWAKDVPIAPYFSASPAGTLEHLL